MVSWATSSRSSPSLTPSSAEAPRRRAAAAALAAGFALAPAPAPAWEAILGLGADGVLDDPHFTVALDVRADPLWAGTLARQPVFMTLGAAVESDTPDDVWAGAGVVLGMTVLTHLRIEASVYPGGYREGTGNDLGADFPMIRSQLEISQPVAEDWRVGLAVSHKSNAHTAVHNPGVETLLVTLRHSF